MNFLFLQALNNFVLLAKTLRSLRYKIDCEPLAGSQKSL